MCSFKSIYFVLFYLVLNNTNGQISDKRLCVDEKCSVPISYAKTLLTYSSPDSRILSFSPNEEVKIYSKSAGSDTSLWGAEIRGRRGYVPKMHVREYKILKKPTFLVDTELVVKDVPKIEPESVKEEFEVVDGTTIYLNPPDISPSSTEELLHSTATPNFNQTTKEKVNDEKQNEENNNKEASTGENSSKPDEKQNEENNNKETSTEENVSENVPDTLNSMMGGSKTEKNSEELDDEEDEFDEEDDETEVDDSDEEEEAKVETITDNISIDKPSSGEEFNNITQEIEKNQSDFDPLKPTDTDDISIDKPSNGEEINNITQEIEKNQIDFDHLKPTEPLTNGIFGDINTASYSANLQEPIMKTDTENLNVKEAEISAEIPKVPTEEPEVIDNTEINVETPNISNEKHEVTEKPEIKMEEQPITTADSSEIKINTPEINIETSEVKIETPVEIKEESISKSDKIVQIIENIVKVPEDTQKEEQLVVDNSHKDEEQPPHSQEIKNEEVQNQENEMQPEDPTPEPVTESQVLLDSMNENVTPQPIHYVQTTEQVVSNIEEQRNMEIADQEVKAKEVPEAPQFNLFGNNEFKRTETEPEAVTESFKANVPEALTQTATEPPAEEAVEAPSGSLFGGFFSGSSEPEVPSTPQPDIQEPSGPTEEVTERVAILDIITEAVIDSNKPGEEDTSPIFVDKIVEADFKTEEDKSPGLFSKMYEYFSPSREEDSDVPLLPELSEGLLPSKKEDKDYVDDKYFSFNGDILMYLTTTAVSVIIFLFGYIAMDKSKRETPLVAKINKLEKQLLIVMKEKELLEEQGGVIEKTVSVVDTGEVEALNQQVAELLNDKSLLEEQVQALEKELDTSTEVGMELNRIVSEMLNSTNGSETLKANVEQLQRQLVEQQDTINTINETLSLKETENVELHLELDINNKKIAGLQSELDKTIDKLLKIEEERDLQQSSLEGEITLYQQKHKDALNQVEILQEEIQSKKSLLIEATRKAELKEKEYNVLKSNLDQIKSFKNDKESLKSILDVTSTKAELQQLKSENKQLTDKLSHEEVEQINLKKQIESVKEECDRLRNSYEAADKEKLEINTKLEVLNNYFKEKEAQLQKEISKYESIWAAKEGEATSTTERIKYIQEELQNYKAQNETLKQEIVNQEVELKSQISVLEKKIHENWVTARQTERKLEDAKQEAAQLRNRLTLRERALIEDKTQNRLQSPMELNGDHPLSPPPLHNPASPPPLLYNSRDHMTKSPPIPSLFLPPPPGAPFMPPPPGMHHPFMPPPPPPNVFPDRRPPPLGRMSSPPPPRYTPDSTVYSGYDRNSPSPPYDSEYGTSPPPPNMRAYSPYNDRREYNRHSHKINGRNAKGSGISSGSDQSHESPGKQNRKQHSKV